MVSQKHAEGWETVWLCFGDRWISGLSSLRSASAAERAQIKLDHKGPNIHWGPRYCQQICPILFAFHSKFRGYVLSFTDLVFVNSVQKRNKTNPMNQNECDEWDSSQEWLNDLINYFPQESPASKKENSHLYIPNHKKNWIICQMHCTQQPYLCKIRGE